MKMPKQTSIQRQIELTVTHNTSYHEGDESRDSRWKSSYQKCRGYLVMESSQIAERMSKKWTKTLRFFLEDEIERLLLNLKLAQMEVVTRQNEGKEKYCAFMILNENLGAIKQMLRCYDSISKL